MLTSTAGRLTGVVLLLVLLVGACLGYASQTALHAEGTIPSQTELADDPTRYVGDPVEVSGTVINTNPVVIVAEYDYYKDGQRQTGAIHLTVRGITQPVAEGELLQVYGVLDSEDALTAERVVVIPDGSVAYMYTVSALAGVWVLGRLLTGWQLTTHPLAIQQRDTPITVTDWLQPGSEQQEGER